MVPNSPPSKDIFDLVIQNVDVISPYAQGVCNLGIQQGKITSFRADSKKSAKVINGNNLTVFPGLIDSQVHFREPGLTHKEDLESGSRASVLGGVTSFMEMPNTKPATTTIESLQQKVDLATNRCHANFGFFIGASANNLEDLIRAEEQAGCVGIKIFLGSSTGDLLLYDPAILKEIFQKTRLPISIHSENEIRLRERDHIRAKATNALAHPEWRDEETAISSTRMILQLARECGRQIHLLHITTGEEMELLSQYRDVATVEVLPQHLTFFSPDCYQKFGSLMQMNPPIRSLKHQQALWKAIHQGVVDVIGSDHAPHTLEEKNKGYPHSPSGIPGAQTIFPMMLDHALRGKLSLHQLVTLLATNPARLFKLSNKGRIEIGMDADLTLVDLKGETTIRLQDMASKCGQTPYDGMKFKGRIEKVFIEGETIVESGTLVLPGRGRALT